MVKVGKIIRIDVFQDTGTVTVNRTGVMGIKKYHPSEYSLARLADLIRIRCFAPKPGIRVFPYADGWSLVAEQWLKDTETEIKWTSS